MSTILLALYLPSLAWGQAKFAEPLKVAADGKRVKISFAVDQPTDVEVAVVDARGKVVRHLAAGMLGGKAPPPAPLAPAESRAPRRRPGG